MSKLFDEFKHDLHFIKNHTLQPKWFKGLKLFILLGFLVGYAYIFGWIKTVLFFAVFIFLGSLVHLIYRVKTNTWKRSWLDFVVVEENGEIRTKHIGKFYYSAVILNAMIALAISQLLP